MREFLFSEVPTFRIKSCVLLTTMQEAWHYWSTLRYIRQDMNMRKNIMSFLSNLSGCQNFRHPLGYKHRGHDSCTCLDCNTSDLDLVLGLDVTAGPVALLAGPGV